MASRLEGKVAIVTGGSRGIGEAIARAFVREGARVAIASRKQEGVDVVVASLEAERRGSAMGRACHVGHPDEVQALVDAVIAAWGPPTVLVNNAGTNPYFGPLLGATGAAWDKTFEVNLRGPFEASRAVAKALVAAKLGGSIIQVSSVLGTRAAPLQGIYGMTKAALISMTQTMAMEWGSARIRVNALAPGLVETKLAAAITGSRDLSQRFVDRCAIPRVGKSEDIAGAAVFLASDESAYVTGQTLCVDGGYTIT
jgi:NAD(P)-dependent dehydrogenase (short-subunit alcohol dehydrogenase family)